MPTKRAPKKSRLSPVAMGNIVRENLPFPIVYYPEHYGTFFVFAEEEDSPLTFCSCSKLAIENYLRLKTMFGCVDNNENVSKTTLDKPFFPKVVTELRFAKGLCHRCNLTAPTLRWCHEMYGVRFIQHYGWYVNQAYFSLGINQHSLDYLPDVCPQEFQQDIEVLRKKEAEELGLVEVGEKISFKHRDLTKKIENIVRQEFGFKGVSKGWVSETMLLQIVTRIFQHNEIISHHRPDWLNGLELDIYIPSLSLGIEYQGQQHFHPIRAWGGQSALDSLRKRDTRKANTCKKCGVRLITVDYTEPLTEEYIRNILESAGISLS